jgi:hypothetical protein
MNIICIIFQYNMNSNNNMILLLIDDSNTIGYFVLHWIFWCLYFAVLVALALMVLN